MPLSPSRVNLSRLGCRATGAKGTFAPSTRDGRSVKARPSLAARSLFALAPQWAGGRDRMLTFRIAITAAVMGFVMALTASLVLIQVATFHVAAKEAASAAMDTASANTLSRLEAQVSELNAVVRVLSTNPSLTDSDDRSEVDGAIVVFKAALRELSQTDSLYVGYDNGCWLQVRRLDVLNPTERQKLGAPPAAVYNINLVRPTPGGALPMRRIFEDGQGNKMGNSICRTMVMTRESGSGIAIRCRQTGRSFRRHMPLSASAHR